MADPDPHTFIADPPPWALELFSDRQREGLTFTKLWSKAVAASDLDRSAKLVGLVLALYFSGGEGEVHDPSTVRLSQEASLSRTTVVKALDQLEAAALIARWRSPGRNRSRYQLTVPERLQLSSTLTVDEVDSSPVDKPSEGGPTVQLAGSTVQLAGSTVQSPTPTVQPVDTKGFEGVVEGTTEGGSPRGGEPGDDPSKVDDQEDQEQQSQDLEDNDLADEHQQEQSDEEAAGTSSPPIAGDPSEAPPTLEQRYHEYGRNQASRLSPQEARDLAATLADEQRRAYLAGYESAYGDAAGEGAA